MQIIFWTCPFWDGFVNLLGCFKMYFSQNKIKLTSGLMVITLNNWLKFYFKTASTLMNQNYEARSKSAKWLITESADWLI